MAEDHGGIQTTARSSNPVARPLGTGPFRGIAISGLNLRKVNLQRLLDPAKAIAPYIERRQKDALPPHSVELHLTSACNYNCYHCSYRTRRLGGLRVSEEGVTRLVNDLLEMRPHGIYWSGGGEPTTIPSLARHMTRVAEAGIEQALVTNAIALSDELLALAPRLNYIAVSFQASDPQTYRRITGRDCRDLLYANIRRLRAALTTDTILGARAVINALNYPEIPAMLRDASALGFDYVIFIPAIDYEGAGGIELDDGQKKFVRDTVRELEPEIDDAYTNLRRLVSFGIRHYAEAEAAPSFPCHSNQMRATAFVNYDGGVWLCQPHIGKPEYCIGNLNERPFRAIWNSVRHLEVLAALHEEHEAGKCKNCRSLAYNRSIESYLKGSGPTELTRDPFL